MDVLNTKPFDGFTQPQLLDMYFYYTAYRDAYCSENNTFAADIGIIDFYMLMARKDGKPGLQAG